MLIAGEPARVYNPPDNCHVLNFRWMVEPGRSMTPGMLPRYAPAQSRELENATSAGAGIALQGSDILVADRAGQILELARIGQIRSHATDREIARARIREGRRGQCARREDHEILGDPVAGASHVVIGVANHVDQVEVGTRAIV